MARLHKHYQEQVIPEMIKIFGYKNKFQVPTIDKVVLNMGVGEALKDKKRMEHAVNDLTLISGQKPLIIRAKKSVATFKLRLGMPIGCKVTLRNARMYEFIDRFINIAMPRVRDFRGFNSKLFDGMGNFNTGLRENIVFPEIDYDNIDQIRGLNITICTSAPNDNEAMHLLKLFSFPFLNS